MNPFDLRGREFLLFYALLSGAVLIAFEAWWALSDRRGHPDKIPADPYLVAYLRGGRAETLRLALLVLIEQGAVTVDDKLLSAAEGDPRRTRAPLETELLAALTRPRLFDSLLDAGEGASACADFQRRLEKLRYVRPERALATARRARAIALGALAVVAAVKVMVAASRGRTNGLLLVALAFLFIWLASRPKASHLTTHGQRALEGLQGLLEDAKQRLMRQGREALGDELAAVGAAFGLGVFPIEDFPFLSALR